ncbi:hypothetical protein C4B63_14g35 [Trypanosoma cruzi]|uniref:Sucrase/ferredoxin-like family protein n=1 Tax=Trypanosoma cruzi TaxID=5693 RepID=A0A2V2VR24_TRYCR|nr:hypothetical protein C4B63_14g35 [Trypanosoma cruzi]
MGFENGKCSGYSALEQVVSSRVGMKLTVFYRPGPDRCILRFKYEESLEYMLITQHSCITEGELPWESEGAISSDRSNEVFIFVCSHRSRDGRCGYCGAVLVELLRQSIRAKKSDDDTIHVYPCSHVGGHIYAGNVLMLQIMEAYALAALLQLMWMHLWIFLWGARRNSRPRCSNVFGAELANGYCWSCRIALSCLRRSGEIQTNKGNEGLYQNKSSSAKETEGHATFAEMYYIKEKEK